MFLLKNKPSPQKRKITAPLVLNSSLPKTIHSIPWMQKSLRRSSPKLSMDSNSRLRYLVVDIWKTRFVRTEEEWMRPVVFWFRMVRSSCVDWTLGHIGTADGSSLVRIGGTGVICGLKLSFDPAKESSDTKGSLGMRVWFLCDIDVNIILSSLCNADFFYGEQEKQSKYYAQVLKQIFQRLESIFVKSLLDMFST